MATTDRATALLAELTTLLTDAAGENKMATKAEVAAIGIPEKHAGSIAQQSGRIETAGEAREAAASWAEYVTAKLEDLEAKVADGSIVDEVPRF